MSESAAWIAGRRPLPAMALDAWVQGPPAGDALHLELAERGRSALAAAASRPGRVRESAFDLLAADALVTYACEAALETRDPELALGEILEVD